MKYLAWDGLWIIIVQAGSSFRSPDRYGCSRKGQSMDFEGAVAAHAQWKIKLRGYLAKPDKSLNPNDIELDNRCALGQWIHGEGGRFASDPDFQELRKEHAKFHHAAAGLIRRADQGEKVMDEAALGAKSPFSQLSQRLVHLIMMMKQKEPVASRH